MEFLHKTAVLEEEPILRPHCPLFIYSFINITSMELSCLKDSAFWASATCEAFSWIPFIVCTTSIFTWLLLLFEKRNFSSSGFDTRPSLAISKVFMLQQLAALPGYWLLRFSLLVTDPLGGWGEAASSCSKPETASKADGDLFQVWALSHLVVLLIWSTYELLSYHSQTLRAIFMVWLIKACVNTAARLDNKKDSKDGSNPQLSDETKAQYTSVKRSCNDDNDQTMQDFLMEMRYRLAESRRQNSELRLELRLITSDITCTPNSPVDCSPPAWDEAIASTGNELRRSRHTSPSSSFEWVDTFSENPNPAQPTTTPSKTVSSSSEPSSTPPLLRTCSSEADSIKDASFAGIGEPYKILADEIARTRREAVVAIFANWCLRDRVGCEMTLAEVVRHATLRGDVWSNLQLVREEFEDLVIGFLMEYSV